MHDATDVPRYAVGRGMVRSLRRRCPVCASADISRHVAAVETTCPNCGLDLERQVGSFIGGVGLNTIASFACLIITLGVGFILTGGEASVARILLPALTLAIVVPLVFYARSRLLWVALELRWWPLEPGEVDVSSSSRVSNSS